MAYSLTISFPSGYNGSVMYRTSSGTYSTTTITGGTAKQISVYNNGDATITTNNNNLQISGISGGVTSSNVSRTGLQKVSISRLGSAGTITFTYNTTSSRYFTLEGFSKTYISYYTNDPEGSSPSYTSITANGVSSGLYMQYHYDTLGSTTKYYGRFKFQLRYPYYYTHTYTFKPKVGNGTVSPTHITPTGNTAYYFDFFNSTSVILTLDLISAVSSIYYYASNYGYNLWDGYVGASAITNIRIIDVDSTKYIKYYPSTLKTTRYKINVSGTTGSVFDTDGYTYVSVTATIPDDANLVITPSFPITVEGSYPKINNISNLTGSGNKVVTVYLRSTTAKSYVTGSVWYYKMVE